MAIGTRLPVVGRPAELPAACCPPLNTGTITPEEAKVTAALFKALADPSRVRIVNELASQPEPVCVCEFTPLLGLAQSTVSHHLKKLTNAGLLLREQRGVWAYYSLNPDAAERLAAVVDLRTGAPTR